MEKTLWGALVAVPFTLLCASACGGSAFNNGTGSTAGDQGMGSSPAAGGDASGGSSSNGGSLSSAGTSSRAGASSGGSSNVAGSTSMGGGGGDDRACVTNTDCQLAPAGCCSCGTGPVSNFIAINSAFALEPRCGDVACSACPPVAADPNDPVRYYVPTCQAHRCVVVDLRATDVTACQSASDCELRDGTACCDGCSGMPVAINSTKQSELGALVCGTAPTACPLCVGLNSGYSADCNAGRCSVTVTPCTADRPCGL